MSMNKSGLPQMQLGQLMDIMTSSERIKMLHASMKSGNTAIQPHDYVVGDFRKIVEKYGADWAEPGKDEAAE